MQSLTLGQAFVLHEEMVQYIWMTNPWGDKDGKSSSPRKKQPEQPRHALHILSGAAEQPHTSILAVTNLDQIKDPSRRESIEWAMSQPGF
jgi:hypothetical protein